MGRAMYTPEQVDAAVREVRRRVGLRFEWWMETTQYYARATAPWTDRGGKDSVTGKTARQSLEGETGTLPNGDLYGVLRSDRESTHAWKGGPHAPVSAFLELKTRRMHRKYEVIWPSLQHRVPKLQEQLGHVIDDWG